MNIHIQENGIIISRNYKNAKFKFWELRKSILVDGGNQNERISIFDWKDYCRSGNYSCRNHYSAGYWWSWRKYPQWLVAIRGCASVTSSLSFWKFNWITPAQTAATWKSTNHATAVFLYLFFLWLIGVPIFFDFLRIRISQRNSSSDRFL